MALQPHPLDSSFSDPRSFEEQVAKSGTYRQACEDARAAFDQTKNGPPVMGPTPEQAARSAFLQRMDRG